MHIRDRIKELRRVRAGDLRPNPRNWRIHPDKQRAALRGILAEIGYADALLARELADGTLELIDGHLRAETTPDAVVPVLILDLNEEEAAKLLALLDPLANLAETDTEALAELASELDLQSPVLRDLLHEMLSVPGNDEESPDSPVLPQSLPESFQVVVECEDEEQQREVFERLSAEGYNCRLLTL
jgi:ParB-like chromosome segregation protein Spo0J